MPEAIVLAVLAKGRDVIFQPRRCIMEKSDGSPAPDASCLFQAQGLKKSFGSNL